MRKKLLGVGLACILLTGSFAGCGTAAESGIELPCYDQSADQNYNPDLFYRNDMTTYSADPSVLWVPEERDSEYGGYFYMFSTGDAGNVKSFGVNRSRNMIDWEYVQTAFLPDTASWAQDRLYAPECIYDETDGKYYLFFSASWDGRENDNLYDSLSEKAEYERAEEEIREYDFDAAQTEIDALRAKFDAETPAAGYTAEEWAQAKQLLADYDTHMSEPDADETQKLVWAQECALGLKTAHITRKAAVNYVHSIGVAVSDSPVGPFYQYTNLESEEFMPEEAYNEDAREIGIGRPFITHEDFYEALAEFEKNGETKKYEALKSVLPDRMTMIDADPFLDPQTGKKYIYFSSVEPTQEYIFGMQLGENWTDDPLWETLTPLTRYGYKTVDGEEEIDYPRGTSAIEEGPHMLYDEETGNYYMTFSVNGAYDKEYAVGQAIGDSPLGPFEKVSMEKGGLVIASDSMWDHVSGPGHHCFLRYDGKLYIFYQGLYERANNQSNARGICVDEVKSYRNDDGTKVFNANGPSYAPMPKAGPDAQYRNIAEEAQITVNRGERKEALNDGLINIMTHHDQIPEFGAAAGKTTITLDFEEYRTIRAIMIFNARDLENWFDKIDRIELDFAAVKDGQEIKATAYMKDLIFDKELYTYEVMETARPGGSVCVEFDEIRVKTVRITIDSDKAFSISEIYVLGK